jgi:dolichol-phosphate mannosyltransferase
VLVNEQGFACMPEILIELARVGIRIREVPMILRYDRKPSVSKIKVLKTVKQTLRLLLKTLSNTACEYLRGNFHVVGESSIGPGITDSKA